jgi:hypothetical protein
MTIKEKQIKHRQARITKLGYDKPATFEELRRWYFKRADGRVSTRTGHQEE